MKKIVNTVFYLIILFMVYALISELKKEPSSSTSVEINDEIANTIPNDSSKLTPLDLATINLKEE